MGGMDDEDVERIVEAVGTDVAALISDSFEAHWRRVEKHLKDSEERWMKLVAVLIPRDAQDTPEPHDPGRMYG